MRTCELAGTPAMNGWSWTSTASPAGCTVGHVSSVRAQGSGNVIPLRGGAFLDISLQAPAYDADGNPTYSPANPSELVNGGGWNTFRQA